MCVSAFVITIMLPALLLASFTALHTAKLPRMGTWLIPDLGWANESRGWYDATCQGAANDYCRYVGDPGPGWWTCALAGGTTTGSSWSPAGQFTEEFTSVLPCGPGGRGHCRLGCAGRP